MSTVLGSIRVALETQLATVQPAISTAYENVPFVPAAGVPYQEPVLLPAKPSNIEIGPGFQQPGIFQVNLFFPKDAGPGAATAQAEAIRSAFPFRASLQSGGVTVNIIGTPEIGQARPDADRIMVPVKISWAARIGA